jgi:tol-pal system protein YbgF
MAALHPRNGLLLLLALPALLGGCAIADTGAFDRLQREVVQLKGQVAELSARPVAPPAPPPPAVGEGEVAAMRRSNADLSATVDQLSGELRAATTRFDEGRTETARTLSRLNDDQTKDRLALQELQGKVKAVDERVKGLEGTARAGAAAHRPAEGGAAVAEAGKEGRKMPAFGRPQDQYDWALGLLKRGDFPLARDAFDAFLQEHADHKLVPNALYWRGETFYAQQDYENAIVAFQDVVDRFPDHEKASDAMLKQGLSFLSLKDAKNGRLLLELVVSKYPKSTAAETARKKLSELSTP